MAFHWNIAIALSPGNLQRYTLSSGVRILQRSDTSLFTSMSDSRFLVLYDLLFTSCDAMELTVMGHGRYGILDLPVRLLIIVVLKKSRPPKNPLFDHVNRL